MDVGEINNLMQKAWFIKVETIVGMQIFDLRYSAREEGNTA